MSSLTLSLSGNSSILSANYFPPIELKDGEYVCGLIDLQTFNTIPNIDINNNRFHFGPGEGEAVPFAMETPGDGIEYNIPTIENEKTMLNNISITAVKCGSLYYDLSEIEIPIGSYEIDDICKFLKKRLEKDSIKFDLRVNKNTLKCEVLCSQPIDFSGPNSIGSLLGFSARILAPNVVHESDVSVNIFRVNAIRLECSITTGAYINNTPAHTIHEFCPTVPPGYKIIEVPRNVIYLPVAVRTIHTLTVKIVDQNNQLVNFCGETITIRIHIKKL